MEPNFVENLCQKDSKSSRGVSIAPVFNVLGEKSWVNLHGARRLLAWCKGGGVLLTSLLDSFPCKVFDLANCLVRKQKLKKNGKGKVKWATLIIASFPTRRL